MSDESDTETEPALATSAKSKQRLWVRLLRWLLVSIVGVIVLVFILEYVIWRSSAGPSGCVAKTYKIFFASDSVDTCLRKRVGVLLKSKGPVAGLAALSEMADHNPLLDARCHLPMHNIGQQYARKGLSDDEFSRLPAKTDFNDVCMKGFVHGYMQGLGAIRETSDTDLVSVAHKLCDPMAAFDRAVCVHGAGHGIARVDNNDLGDASVSCAQMTTRDDQVDCIKGAVMEIQLASPGLKNRMRFDKSLGPARDIDCSRVVKEQRLACRQRQVGGKLLELSFRTGTS